MAKWKPIKTARKRFAPMILLTDGKKVGEGWWAGNIQGFRAWTDYGLASGVTYTHWQPLPTPPPHKETA